MSRARRRRYARFVAGSVLALAGCAGAPPPAAPAGGTPAAVAPVATPIAPPPAEAVGQALEIQGRLGYLARVALPPEAILIVELRDAASGALLAADRRRLDGAQVPLPFRLRVPRERLSSGGPYTFRGGVVIDERAAWLGPAITLAGDDTRVELGDLRMQPAAAGAARPD